MEACGVIAETRLRAGAVVDVYRGRLADGGPVAIKLTGERAHGHPGASALVEREHRMLIAVDDPRVVRPLRFARRAGSAALVIEYLPGGDLVPLAAEPPAAWADAALDIVAGLRAAHAAGIVHGDLKARNVLFAADGRAKLIDFGSALAVGQPRRRGGRTPAHEPLRFTLDRAAPEQDVYALAVLLYELAAGRLPFGTAPSAYAPPPPLRAATAAERALAERISATLAASDPAGTGTLLEFADVLESVRGETAGRGGSQTARSSAGAAGARRESLRTPGASGRRTGLDD